ncbi:MAG: hypothetical protein HYZ14_19525 [Bacteroidetes bacterium]|nr:hypothetical protein [Bacteroidota bacterium]
MIRKKPIWTWALLLSVLFFTGKSIAQDKPLRLIFAETVSDYKGQVNTTKAVGNVQFEYTNTRLFCDSAIFLRVPNLIYAYGHVQINQGDTINLFCDSLLYDGNTNISKLRSNVRFRDNEYKLVTDSLDYNGNLSLGYYKNHAVISSIRDDSKLTSVKGYYYSNTKTFFFKDSVHVANPEYELFSDTLEFRTLSSSAHFHGPTRILLDSSEVNCNRGVYWTDQKLIHLWNGASILEKGRSFYADSLIFNQATDEGEGFCAVRMYDSTENVLFLADYLFKAPDNVKLTLLDNAHVIQFGEKDTLFLSADTIYSFRDTVTEQSSAIAIHAVELINAGIFVACDSAYFSERDSILKLHQAPVMWSQNSQISGDSILATYYNNEFHRLLVYENAFIASEHDSIHYDQIRGKMMTAFMDSSKIQRIFIETNAQTLYYVSETTKDTTGADVKNLSGLNQIDCVNIVVYFSNSAIQNISFNEKPTGTYTPFEDIAEKQLFFKGFLWQIDRKPKPIFLE